MATTSRTYEWTQTHLLSCYWWCSPRRRSARSYCCTLFNNRCVPSVCSCVSQNTHRRRASAVRFSAFRLPNPTQTRRREVHGGLWPRLNIVLAKPLDTCFKFPINYGLHNLFSTLEIVISIMNRSFLIMKIFSTEPLLTAIFIIHTFENHLLFVNIYTITLLLMYHCKLEPYNNKR